MDGKGRTSVDSCRTHNLASTSDARVQRKDIESDYATESEPSDCEDTDKDAVDSNDGDKNSTDDSSEDSESDSSSEEVVSTCKKSHNVNQKMAQNGTSTLKIDPNKRDSTVSTLIVAENPTKKTNTSAVSNHSLKPTSFEDETESLQKIKNKTIDCKNLLVEEHDIQQVIDSFLKYEEICVLSRVSRSQYNEMHKKDTQTHDTHHTHQSWVRLAKFLHNRQFSTQSTDIDLSEEQQIYILLYKQLMDTTSDDQFLSFKRMKSACMNCLLQDVCTCHSFYKLNHGYGLPLQELHGLLVDYPGVSELIMQELDQLNCVSRLFESYGWSWKPIMESMLKIWKDVKNGRDPIANCKESEFDPLVCAFMVKHLSHLFDKPEHKQHLRDLFVCAIQKGEYLLVKVVLESKIITVNEKLADPTFFLPERGPVSCHYLREGQTATARSPLWIACTCMQFDDNFTKSNSVESYDKQNKIIHLLLSHGAKAICCTELQNKEECTDALQRACARSDPNPTLINSLLAFGANVNAVDTSSGLTSLMLYLKHCSRDGDKNLKIMKSLVSRAGKHGVNIKCGLNFATISCGRFKPKPQEHIARVPLMMAQTNSQVAMLVQHGANLNDTDSNGKHVWWYLINILTEESLLSNFMDRTACGVDIFNDRYELQDKGFEKWYGKTSLEIAVDNKLVSIIKFLLKNGAEAEPQLQHIIPTLINSEQIASDDKSEIIKLVVQSGQFEVNAKDSDGNTILHHLARQKTLSSWFAEFMAELVHYLIENGADINIKNDDGRTPLQVVGVSPSSFQFVKAIFNNVDGMDIKLFTDRYRKTILHRNYDDKHYWMAISVEEASELVDYVVKLGLDLNSMSLNGYTSLMRAVKQKRANLIEALVDVSLKGKGNIDLRLPAKRSYRKTALMLAFEQVVNDGDYQSECVLKALLKACDASDIVHMSSNMININYQITNSYGVFLRLLTSTRFSHRRIVCVLEHLLEKCGVDINEADSKGNTVLMILANRAERIGSYVEQRMSFCINHGANVDIQDKMGDTVIIKMVKKLTSESNYQLVRLLMRSGADVNLENKNGESARSVVFSKLKCNSFAKRLSHRM